MIANALFERDSSGKLFMTTKAPMFVQARSRISKIYADGYHEGLLWLMFVGSLFVIFKNVFFIGAAVFSLFISVWRSAFESYGK